MAALKEGVRRFGVGNWQKIVNDYPVLRHRTGVQLKDKVRKRDGPNSTGGRRTAWPTTVPETEAACCRHCLTRMSTAVPSRSAALLPGSTET